MQTILHQGKPSDGDPHWHPLPEHSVASYKGLGYQVRELVLRADAEQAIERAAKLAEPTNPALAKQIRMLIEQKAAA